MSRDEQLALFGFGDGPDGPEGFRYQPELVSADEERELVGQIEGLPFANFQFHGHEGKRRVVSFGWRYDFEGRGLVRADDVPAFLMPLRARAAALAGFEPASFQHVLVTEYAPGTGIGWHRDKPEFDEVVGVSLGSGCDFRFRRRSGARWERRTVPLAARSAYLLSGPARTAWEHSILAVPRLRYSVTFRNVRADR
ncbi:MAG TPA: alpha-ketoglutarate-dependent dioxygenase AlkB [Tepidisphaeraceae bacterium]|nr:alpha-ketoglutarate-dependent dioxygenase AlkB [Tepidisphaeraceae bacterium]